MSKSPIGTVIFSSPQSIWVEINDEAVFELHKKSLQIGRYLSISDGNLDQIICSIQNIKAKDMQDGGRGKFIIETQPVGMVTNAEFYRGNQSLPVPLEQVYIADEKVLGSIYDRTDEFNFEFGNLLQNKETHLHINGNKFFGKHICVVGSTGSGKSCAVARILQTAIGIDKSFNLHKKSQKNSHIIIFDIHSEYKKAFELSSKELFNLNYLDVSKLKLPYWLMNSEELESIFIESNEANSHNQISLLKTAIIANKEKYNPTLENINYDTPAYFSLDEVYNYISNMNSEIIGRLENENVPKLKDGTLVTDRFSYYFEKIHQFVEQSSVKADKATSGPFNNDLNRFILRLENKKNDKRLKFLFDPKQSDGSVFKTDDFNEILKQFIGYNNQSNVTIIDLSGVPFEVLSITVSLISRIIFDFCFYYSKLQSESGLLNDNPVLMVFEEAHNYVPRSELSAYKSSRVSVERITKEGRKYGLCAMIVSQRPSEISETILSQCSNFVAMRLTNPADQNYIKRLLPDSTNAISDILPSLGQGQCLLVGDSVPIPSLVQLAKPDPAPASDDIKTLTEWNTVWKNIQFEQIIKKWKKDSD